MKVDVERWRCKSCVDNGLEVDDEDKARASSRKGSPVSHVARELLASHRGASRPDEHSVFNTLILEDDPMDGSRSLRKRKASIEEEAPPKRSHKRRRPSEIAAATAGANRSPESSPALSRKGEAETLANSQPNGAAADGGSPRPRSGRARRVIRKPNKKLTHIVSTEGISLILSFNLNNEKMQKVLSQKPKKKAANSTAATTSGGEGGGGGRKRDRARRKIAPPMLVETEPPHYPPLPSSYNAAMFIALGEKDDETKNKPYGGILSETEADTSKTFPQVADRKKFEEARLKAEEDWKKKMALRNTLPEPTRPSQKMSGPPSKIKCINFGGFEIETWNAAPYPEEYSRNKILYICEFCLKYMNSDYVAWRHKVRRSMLHLVDLHHADPFLQLKCPAKHPPGDEIYRDGKYSFFEVDGRKNAVYCQNLCLLAKLFLGSKTLYYDVEPFLFYVMTENDDMGCHFVGYFSKEKRPSSLNNVSCILVLPIFQRRGFGHMLIEFSYLLTRVEKKTGSPEKPLSDMGLVSYRGYWRLMMCYQLRNQTAHLSISDLSDRTGMTADDIVSALEGLRALVQDPVTKTYALRIDHAYYTRYIKKNEEKDHPRINPDCLVWVPYVMNRGLERHFEEAGVMHTVAQREDEADAEDEGTQDDQDDLATKSSFKVPLINGDVTILDALTPTDVASGSHWTPPHSQPTTPLPNGLAAAIPATRFEVFPRVPGTQSKRRGPGRPFGSRTRIRTMTPVKRNAASSGLSNGAEASTPVTATRIGAITLELPASPVVNGDGRRTRSSLRSRPSTVNGLNERESNSSSEDEAEEGAVGEGEPDEEDEEDGEAEDDEEEEDDEDGEAEDDDEEGDDDEADAEGEEEEEEE